ncbi:MAG: 16S rRNA (cytidine(1402)-2'-O)-methyltransferase [Synechococcus sp. SB0678_bin_12]|nr:16S rRNA (cytidine(1402)-2'-O)-methyltransferase [Synechococcus sp. SB0678_bin_12]MYI87067.1 16S rRNA (cytidine(1402)-2'-O)-methyltransferase [Synechococcus sp. SB0672_bin_10]
MMATQAGAIVEQPREEPHGGVLYVVGTPIGNREDFSPRARRILEQVDVIACEDTRHSARLLRDLSGHGRLISFHRHNRRQRQPQLLALMTAGHSLALISDAGLPGISDPGEELVAAARQVGHGVVCIPGPTAFVTALVGSGLPCGRFVFEGFLPARPSARRQRLQHMAGEPRTVVFHEAPHRLLVLLEDLLELWGDRPLQVARELTKHHEEFIGPTTAMALDYFRGQSPRGECCVVVGGCPEPGTLPWDGDALATQLQQLIREDGLSPSQAARILAQRSGHSRQRLYALLLQQRRGEEQGTEP